LDPFTTAAFAWQAGMVFTLRSFQLLTQPAMAQAMLTEYAFEKHRAFSAGALAASQAMLAGAAAPAVMAAALRPAHRRVRVNHRKLMQG
jgi:hypothetical protein